MAGNRDFDYDSEASSLSRGAYWAGSLPDARETRRHTGDHDDEPGSDWVFGKIARCA